MRGITSLFLLILASCATQNASVPEPKPATVTRMFYSELVVLVQQCVDTKSCLQSAKKTFEKIGNTRADYNTQEQYRIFHERIVQAAEISLERIIKLEEKLNNVAGYQTLNWLDRVQLDSYGENYSTISDESGSILHSLENEPEKWKHFQGEDMESFRSLVAEMAQVMGLLLQRNEVEEMNNDFGVARGMVDSDL